MRNVIACLFLLLFLVILWNYVEAAGKLHFFNYDKSMILKATEVLKVKNFLQTYPMLS